MYGCAHHRAAFRKDAGAEAVEQNSGDTRPVVALIAENARSIDRETMLRLGLPASMIERLLERK